jgi:two-component system NtrC family sensor kinase
MAEPLSLLVIEDNPDIALLMRRYLERAGHHVTVCPTAEAALPALDGGCFDLISLDMVLPGMNGLDFLRNLNRAGITTPVIMVTPIANENLATQVLRDGALDFVVMDPGLKFLAELPERAVRAVMRFRSCNASAGDKSMLHLLVDFLDPSRPVDAKALLGLLLPHPGVLSVCVNAAVRQVAVVLAGDPANAPEEVQALLWAAGHLTRVSRVPGPEEDSAYARYYYSDLDSAEERWRD